MRYFVTYVTIYRAVVSVRLRPQALAVSCVTNQSPYQVAFVIQPVDFR